MFILLALVNGTITVLSRIVNAALAARVGSLRGSLVNHAVGLGFAGLLLIAGLRTGTFQWEGIPLVYFVGGCLGVLVVAASNYAVQHIGAVLFSVLLLAFQLLTSAVIDHFGLMGGDTIPLTGPRALGLVLLVVGAVLVITDRTTPSKESLPSPSQPAPVAGQEPD